MHRCLILPSPFMSVRPACSSVSPSVHQRNWVMREYMLYFGFISMGRMISIEFFIKRSRNALKIDENQHKIFLHRRLRPTLNNHQRPHRHRKLKRSGSKKERTTSTTYKQSYPYNQGPPKSRIHYKPPFF